MTLSARFARLRLFRRVHCLETAVISTDHTAASAKADLDKLIHAISACESCGAIYLCNRLAVRESKDGTHKALLCGTCKHVYKVTGR